MLAAVPAEVQQRNVEIPREERIRRGLSREGSRDCVGRGPGRRIPGDKVTSIGNRSRCETLLELK